MIIPLAFLLTMGAYATQGHAQDPASLKAPDQIDVPLHLKFRAAKEEGIVCEPHVLTGSEFKPDSLHKSPQFSGKVKYYSFELGLDQRLTYIFALEKSDSGQLTTYLDLNRNGDLTDDKPYQWPPMQAMGGERGSSLSIEVPYPGGTGAKFGLSFQIIESQSVLTIMSENALVGYMQINGKPYKIHVTTAEYIQPLNGLYPDRKPLIMIDWNGNGKFDLPSDQPNGEIFHLANSRVIFGGKTYSGTVSYKPTMITLKAR